MAINTKVYASTKEFPKKFPRLVRGKVSGFIFLETEKYGRIQLDGTEPGFRDGSSEASFTPCEPGTAVTIVQE